MASTHAVLNESSLTAAVHRRTAALLAGGSFALVIEPGAIVVYSSEHLTRLAALPVRSAVLGLVATTRHLVFVATAVDAVRVCALVPPSGSACSPESSSFKVRVLAVWKPVAGNSIESAASACSDDRFLALVTGGRATVLFSLEDVANEEASTPACLSAVELNAEAVLRVEFRPRTLVGSAALNGLQRGVTARKLRAAAESSPACLLVFLASGSVCVWRESDPWSPLSFSKVCILVGPQAIAASAAWVQRLVLHDRLHWHWDSASESGVLDGAALASHAPPLPLDVLQAAHDRAFSSAKCRSHAMHKVHFPVSKRILESTRRHSVNEASSARLNFGESCAGPPDIKAPKLAPAAAFQSSRSVDGAALSARSVSLAWTWHGHEESSLLTGAVGLMRSDPPMPPQIPSSADYAVVFRRDSSKPVDTGAGLFQLWRILGARDVPLRAVSAQVCAEVSLELGSGTWGILQSESSTQVLSAGISVPSLVVPHGTATRVRGVPALTELYGIIINCDALQEATMTGRASVRPHQRRESSGSLTSSSSGDSAPSPPSCDTRLRRRASSASAGRVEAALGRPPVALPRTRSFTELATAENSSAVTTTGTVASIDDDRTARARSKAASALATAAAVDATDALGDSWRIFSGAHDKLQRNVPRIAARSGNRGTCASVRDMRMPSRSTLFLHRPDTSGSDILTVQVDWVARRADVKLPGVIDDLQTQSNATRDTDALGTQSNVSQHHPQYIIACLRAGKPGRAAAVLANVMHCIERDAQMKRFAQTVLRRRGDRQSNAIADWSVMLGLETPLFVPPLPLHVLMFPPPIAASSDAVSSSTAATAGRRIHAESDADASFMESPEMPPALLHAWLRGSVFHDLPIPTHTGDVIASCVETQPTAQTRLFVPSRRFKMEDISTLTDFLSSRAVCGLTASEQLNLLAVAQVVGDLHCRPNAQAGALDPAAAQFLLSVRLFHVLRGVLLPADRPASLSYVDCLWALQSDSQDALYSLCVPAQLTWADFRALRIPLWLRSDDALRRAVECVGKTLYAHSRDPFSAMLPYLAVGIDRLSVVRGLFRVSAQHQKVYALLLQDFSDERVRRIAAKNAFALLAQHRYEPAAAFFLLAGRPAQAVKTATMELRDPMLALTLARLTRGNFSGASRSAEFGSLDGQALLREVGQALLESTRRSRAAAASGVAYSSGSVASPQVMPSSALALPSALRPKAGIGFGFDDDADHLSPTVSSTPSLVASASSPVGTPSTPVPNVDTRSTEPATVLPQLYGSSIDLGFDPVGFVLQSEFLAAGLGVALPTPSELTAANSDEAISMAVLALWLLRRPLSAMVHVCQALGCGGARPLLPPGVAAVQLGSRCVSDPSLARLVQHVLARPQVQRANVARAISSMACDRAIATLDVDLTFALHDMLLAARLPLMALDEVSVMLPLNGSESKASKSSLFADFNASIASSTSSSHAPAPTVSSCLLPPSTVSQVIATTSCAAVDAWAAAESDVVGEVSRLADSDGCARPHDSLARVVRCCVTSEIAVLSRLADKHGTPYFSHSRDADAPIVLAIYSAATGADCWLAAAAVASMSRDPAVTNHFPKALLERCSASIFDLCKAAEGRASVARGAVLGAAASRLLALRSALVLPAHACNALSTSAAVLLLLCALHERAWPALLNITTCLTEQPWLFAPTGLSFFSELTARHVARGGDVPCVFLNSQLPLDAWLSGWVDAAAAVLVLEAAVGFAVERQAAGAIEPGVFESLVRRFESARSIIVSGGPVSQLPEAVLLQMPLAGIAAARWGVNEGARAAIVKELTGLGAHGATGTSHHGRPWWLDTDVLFRAGHQATCVWQDGGAGANESLAALERLWVVLGGPGLLWVVATERRALVRAQRRQLRGSLPELRKDVRIMIRPPGGPALLHVSQLELRDTVLGDSAYLPSGHVSATVCRVTPPVLLLASADAGVSHVAVRRIAHRASPVRRAPVHRSRGSVEARLSEAAVAFVAAFHSPHALEADGRRYSKTLAGEVGIAAAGSLECPPPPHAPGVTASSSTQLLSHFRGWARNALHDVHSLVFQQQAAAGTSASSDSAGIPEADLPRRTASPGLSPSTMTHKPLPTQQHQPRPMLARISSSEPLSSPAETRTADIFVGSKGDSPGGQLGFGDAGASPLVVDVWPTDLHEYALPFTRAPSAVAQHPNAPLYVRGGPEGLVAVCSLTLEPMPLRDIPVAHRSTGGAEPGGDVTKVGVPVSWHRYVHRVHAIFSYDPLPGPDAAHGGMGRVAGEGMPATRRGSVASRPVPALHIDAEISRPPTHVSRGRGGGSGSLTPTPAGVAGASAEFLDELILRVRWAPDGSRVLACFASGFVRVWDAAQADRPAHVLSTSGASHSDSSNAGASKDGAGSLPLPSELLESQGSRDSLDTAAARGPAMPLWAATEVVPLTQSGSIIAVSAAPRALLRQAARPPEEPQHLRSSLPLSTSSTDLRLSDGWGVRVWDLGAPSGAVVVAALVPSTDSPGGCTALLYDECSQSLYAGCDDGALLWIDARTWAVRVRIPGVPMQPQKPPSSRAAAPLPSAPATGRTGGPQEQEPRWQARPASDPAACYAHAGPVAALCAHPSRRILVSGGALDGDVRAWALPALEHVVTVPALHGHSAAPAAAAVQRVSQHHHPQRGMGAAGGAELGGGSGSGVAESAPGWWADKRGVSGLAATEDFVVSVGYDGACYALHQVW